MFDKIKNDPILKGAVIIVISIVVFGLIYMLFGGIFGNGNTYSMNANNTMGYQNNVNGFGLASVLTFLLKLLIFISIIGLLVAVFMFVKQNYSEQIGKSVSIFKSKEESFVNCPKCSNKVPDKSKFCPSCGEQLKSECKKCGTEVNAEWKCCPNCGAEKE
jgi:RNA polymerase subunit RPABC4/transcription elongation factor Spt4